MREASPTLRIIDETANRQRSGRQWSPSHMRRTVIGRPDLSEEPRPVCEPKLTVASWVVVGDPLGSDLAATATAPDGFPFGRSRLVDPQLRPSDAISPLREAHVVAGPGVPQRIRFWDMRIGPAPGSAPEAEAR